MTTEEREFSRRRLLGTSLVLGGAFLSRPLSDLLAQSSRLTPTSEQGMGPFYPVLKPADQDPDLTAIQGKPGKAQGQTLRLSGRVLNLKGQPLVSAQVEIWQANASGRYDHPGDANPAPLDPNFTGYGVVLTDPEGWYRFKTVKPGPYPAEKGWTRPPHVHFQITAKANRLVTQMYFPGEGLNEKDRLFKTAADPGSLLAKVTSSGQDGEPGALTAVWDIILPRT